MAFVPRFYQQEAHDAVIEWWKHTTDPCLIEAATGAGKSWIIAMIAKTLFHLSGGKRVLCLAPSGDLIDQNTEKFAALGEPFSIYSASISKSLRHPVVFATEGTFKRVARQLGSQFSGVILDEAHRITPTIKKIIDEMKEGNPNLRVCGLTATPYRLGDGFIFAVDTDGKAIPEEQAREPYYKKLVYYIGAQQLTDLGFLTPVKVGDINAESYDTSGILVQRNGKFKQSTVDTAFEGWGRQTSAIIADVVAQSVGKMGVMIFAATVRHAEEIMASLPPSMSRMVGGNHNMKKDERRALRKAFANQEFKYLVSVGTMTTGVDFSHVDVVAILRSTESVSLLQQIIGRGLRLNEYKPFLLLLDYANNIDKHCPDGDIFRPEIRAAYQGGESVPIEAKCEDCGGVNIFSARPNDDGLNIDDYGYFTDLDGNRIQADGVKMPMPAHYGRRCQQQIYSRQSKSYERCDYYWSFKECPVCEHRNDIAARFCESCREELINPNDKLIAIHTKMKKDPTQPQCDEVVDMQVFNTLSRAGNKTMRVQFVVPSRMFSVYLQPEARNQYLLDQYEFFMNATDGGTEKPRTISYKKDGDFYRLLGMNKPTDDEVLKNDLSRIQ